MSSKCVSFYILHVNKCGFLVCRLVDAETILIAISQQDKLKLNQAQPPHLHHLSHLYHSSPACTPSLLVHFLSHSHYSKLVCTSHPAQVHHTRPACTSHLAQVHHTSTACITLPHLFHHPNPACTALPHLFHHPSSMHNSSPSAHQTPTGSSNPIAPPNLGISPIPRLRRKRMVTSETLNASKNASRYMGTIKFAGSQSSTHAPRRNE